MERTDWPAPVQDEDRTVRLTVEVTMYGKAAQVEREVADGLAEYLVRTFAPGQAVLRRGRHVVPLPYEEVDLDAPR